MLQALNRAIAAGGGLGSTGVPALLTAVAGGDGRAELANVNTLPCWPHTRARRLLLSPTFELTIVIDNADLEDEGQDALSDATHETSL